ncbi:MAG: YihA family ribosome biogenesis GTP-binding protein [Clostridia bacterium]|nr:YihA family ribosome biogenesis GTP-binding protein [Clostridia bacterium]
MKITTPKFVTSVASEKNFLKTDKPIIAVAGKSNVGKSSLINMLAGMKKLAKTSNTPGRTRLINYFDFGAFMLVDLPGYGFARVNKEEKQKWGKLMEGFLSSQKIALLLSLVDIRHDPTADDVMMINYLYHYAIPFALVATKADKLAKTKVKPRLKEVATFLRVTENELIATSAESRLGKESVFDAIERAITVSAENQGEE